MQVVHALSRVAAGIGDDAIALAIEILVTRHLGGEGQEASQQTLAIRAAGISNRRDVSRRYHQHMDRCACVDVAKGERVLRPLHDLRRDLTRHDFAEETVSHARSAIGRPMLPRQRLMPRFRTAGYGCRASPAGSPPSGWWCAPRP